MVLSDADIKKALKEGEMEIAPFHEGNLTPNGYDLSVESVLVPGSGARTDSDHAAIPPKTWFVIGTQERVRLGRGLAAQLWLRTTYARKGILATFGKVDAGFAGTLTVSAFNSSEATVEIPVGERFCQMVVERLDTPSEKSYAERSGRYQNQKGITLSAWDNEGAGARGPGPGETTKKTEAPSRAQRTFVPRSHGSVGPGKARPARFPAAPGPGTRDPLPATGQVCRRHGCARCCRATEMPLTAEDIQRVKGLGFQEEDFVEPVEGWLRLKNTMGGECYFLRDGLCSIYPHRPEGCSLYPAVFDADSGRAALDAECPHRDEYGAPAKLVQRVFALVQRLQRERRGRDSRKVKRRV